MAGEARFVLGMEPPMKSGSTYWELSNEFTFVNVGVGLSKDINSASASESIS